MITSISISIFIFQVCLFQWTLGGLLDEFGSQQPSEHDKGPGNESSSLEEVSRTQPHIFHSSLPAPS